MFPLFLMSLPQAAPAGFTPIATNLIADWDVAHATLSGSLITALPDQSGHSNDLSAAGGSEPTYNSSDADFNGKPSCTIPDNDTKLFTSPNLGIAGGDFSIYFVATCDGDNSLNRRLFSDAGGDIQIYQAATNAHITAACGGSTLDSGVLGSVKSVYALILNSGTATLYVNAATPQSGGSSGTALGVLTVGNYAPLVLNIFMWAGRFARALVYSAAHGSTDRNTTMNGLKTFYGTA